MKTIYNFFSNTPVTAIIDFEDKYHNFQESGVYWPIRPDHFHPSPNLAQHYTHISISD